MQLKVWLQSKVQRTEHMERLMEAWTKRTLHLRWKQGTGNAVSDLELKQPGEEKPTLPGFGSPCSVPGAAPSSGLACWSTNPPLRDAATTDHVTGLLPQPPCCRLKAAPSSLSPAAPFQYHSPVLEESERSSQWPTAPASLWLAGGLQKQGRLVH